MFNVLQVQDKPCTKECENRRENCKASREAYKKFYEIIKRLAKSTTVDMPRRLSINRIPVVRLQGNSRASAKKKKVSFG